MIGLSCIIICISVISTITTVTKKFDNKNSSSALPVALDFKATALDIIASTVIEEEEKEPLTMDNVSSVILTNKGVEEDHNPKRAGLLKFFSIPIAPESVINLTNNSTEFKFSVICFSDNLIYDYNGSDWVLPGATISYTPDQNQKYI